MNGMPVKFLIDTGAAVTLVTKHLWDQGVDPRPSVDKWDAKPLIGVDGTPLNVYGRATVEIVIGKKSFQQSVVIVDKMTTDAILGSDFLESHGCIIDTNLQLLFIQEGNVTIPFIGAHRHHEADSQSINSVSLSRSITLPPRSKLEVMVDVTGETEGRTCMVQGNPAIKVPLLVARELVNPTRGQVPVSLVNPGIETINMKKGTVIGTIEKLDNFEIFSVRDAGDTSMLELREGDVKDQLLQDLIGKSQLSRKESFQLLQVLRKYANVFSGDKYELGRTNLTQHNIPTGSARPIRQSLRRLPPSRKKVVEEHVQDMLQRDLIQPSNSSWASPIVLVKKKDGSFRFCVDYRKLNSVTMKDAYPLPRVDDTLDMLSGCKWFSTLDLTSGYWQVEVAPQDRHKTAFSTPKGLFNFKVMPFGLCNAPATFQRLMNTVLAGLQWECCLVYLDDIIVVGRTFEEHLTNLQRVLSCLLAAGLRLQPSKCHLCRRKVTFLGHVISEHGIATDPEKIQTVETWPTPSSCREVQRFLGFVNYYRRFIKDFSQIAKPLTKLTEKSCKFVWTSECDNAFATLRKKLTSSPILSFPDFSKPFILDTDASSTGIGAVLSQKQDDGTETVIAYASRTLTKPERNYCVTRKELLAVIYFIEHFRPYTLGNSFTLRTDHNSLKWLWNFKEPEGQLARWLQKLQEYTFTIIHRPGKMHTNADALSRKPCPQCNRLEERPAVDTVCLTSLQQEAGDLHQLQRDDDVIGPIIRMLENGEIPSRDQLQLSPESRKLQQIYKQLVLIDGLLYRAYLVNESSVLRHQLVIPKALREIILAELHSGSVGGHLGREKMLLLLKERYYWPGHYLDVTDWIAKCEPCTTRKSPHRKQKAPLKRIRSGYPMQLVAVDIMGPLPTSSHGNTYVLVAGDYFTKWIEAYAIPNQEATTVATKLINEFFFRFSPPDQLHSDQGRQFESQLLSEVCRILHIHKSRTTPYHPQSDGMIERFNRTLLDMLATTVKENPTNWESHLRQVCLAYNTTVHSTTGFTPFYLMFGRQARLPIDLMYGSPEKELPVHEYAATLRTQLQRAYQLVRDITHQRHQYQKPFYDSKVHGSPYSPGDFVWVFSNVVQRGQNRKLHHPWIGPFKVLEKLSDVTYRVKNLRGNRRQLVIHFDRLKPCSPHFIPDQITPRLSHTESKVTHPQMPNIGDGLELIDTDEPNVHAPVPTLLPGPAANSTPIPQPRYPSRDRHPTLSSFPFVSH